MSSHSKRRKITTTPPSTPSDHCFFCGDQEVASQRQAQRLYQKQVELYKKLILAGDDHFSINLNTQLASQNGENSACSGCLSSIKHVWDLQQQIEAIQQDISEVINKARDALLLRNPVKQEIDFQFEEPEVCDNFLEDLCQSPELQNGMQIADVLDSNLEEDETPPLALQNEEPQVRTRPVRQSFVKAKESLSQLHQESKSWEAQDIDVKDEVDADFDDSSEECDSEDDDAHNHKAASNSSTAGEETNSWKCLKCNKSYKFKRYLTRHTKDVHLKPPSTTQEKQQCSKCLKTLSSHKSLLVHQVIVCKMQVDPEQLIQYNIKFLNCDQCPAKFYKSKDFRRHYPIHTGERPFSCTKCGKTFGHESALKGHQKIVCTSDKSYQKYLQERAKIASAKKPFRCSKCNKRFPLEALLVTHKAQDCSRRMEANAVCHLCGKELRKTELKDHQRRVHEQVKKHFCPKEGCGRGFFEGRDLRRHLETHEKKKEFNCDLCSRSFAHGRSLLTHKKKFHGPGGEDKECEICGDRFASGEDYQKHKMRHEMATL